MDVRRVAIAALSVALAVLAIYNSPLLRGRKPPAPAPPAPAPVQTEARREVPRLAAAELEAWRARHGRALPRDPFFTADEEAALRAPRGTAAPVAATPALGPLPPSLPTYTVSLVLISEGARLAAIDGRLVSEGEMLGRERVVEIQPDGVLLEWAGKRRRIEVAGGQIPIVESTPRGRRSGR